MHLNMYITFNWNDCYLFQYMTNSLEKFSSFSYIWLNDREAEVEKFLFSRPLLMDFVAMIKSYDDVEEDIKELPEYYDVGPISLLSGCDTDSLCCFFF